MLSLIINSTVADCDWCIQDDHGGNTHVKTDRDYAAFTVLGCELFLGFNRKGSPREQRTGYCLSVLLRLRWPSNLVNRDQLRGNERRRLRSGILRAASLTFGATRRARRGNLRGHQLLISRTFFTGRSTFSGGIKGLNSTSGLKSRSDSAPGGLALKSSVPAAGSAGRTESAARAGGPVAAGFLGTVRPYVLQHSRATWPGWRQRRQTPLKGQSLTRCPGARQIGQYTIPHTALKADKANRDDGISLTSVIFTRRVPLRIFFRKGLTVVATIECTSPNGRRKARISASGTSHGRSRGYTRRDLDSTDWSFRGVPRNLVPFKVTSLHDWVSLKVMHKAPLRRNWTVVKDALSLRNLNELQ